MIQPRLEQRMEPEFQPYGLPHLTVIFLTIVLPFVLAAIVWRTKSPPPKNDHYQRSLGGSDRELCRLSDLHPQPWHRDDWQHMLPMQLCDWGMVGRNRGDVDRKSALVRGGVFLGDWRHVASRAHARLALWFSRLAIYQFFHLALRYHRRRGIPDVDPRIPTIPHVDRARVSLVGVLFCGYPRYRQTDGFNYGFLLHKPEAFSILSFLSDSWPLYLLQMHGLALLFFLGLYAPFAIYDL